MKKLGIFYCLLFVIYSCIGQKNLSGNFQYKGISNGFYKEYNLLIKKDSFKISYKSQDAFPNCIGKLQISLDTLYLRCNNENIAINMLSNRYMNQRDYKFKIISNKKLMLFKENIVFEKK